MFYTMAYMYCLLVLCKALVYTGCISQPTTFASTHGMLSTAVSLYLTLTNEVIVTSS